MPDVKNENWVAYVVTTGIFDYADMMYSEKPIEKIVEEIVKVEKEYLKNFQTMIIGYKEKWLDKTTGAPILQPLWRDTQPQKRKDIVYLSGAWNPDEEDKQRGLSIPRRDRLVMIAFDNTREILAKFSEVLVKNNPVSVTDEQLRAGVPDKPGVLEWFFWNPEQPENVPPWVWSPKGNQGQ